MFVPDLWKISRTRLYFNTSEYSVKKTRKLKATEGVLSLQCGKKDVKLSSEFLGKVITFYYNDDNSCICSGKKKIVPIY